jgi:hypothetical protein
MRERPSQPTRRERLPAQSTLISPLPERGPSDITSPNERLLAPIGTTSPGDTLPVAALYNVCELECPSSIASSA